MRIALIGDSTQTKSAGYGLGFCANLTDDVVCINDAKGGASTKTYYNEGYWTKALADKPDYMLIQFGHNDEESAQHMPRETNLVTEYPANLKRYVEEARAHGIVPVLVTPLARRYYGDDGKIHSDLLAHAEAMKKVATEEKTPLIDLQADSIAFLDTLNEAQANLLGITKKDAQGNTIPDKTHLNAEGSYAFGRIVAVDLGKAVPALAKYVRPEAAMLPPDLERTVAIIRGAPVKIVLAGDSTVNNGGGWGPGFCADLTPNVDCVNLARNGRSSKSYYDEGVWKDVLAAHGDYILIQFGHNDMPGKGPDARNRSGDDVCGEHAPLHHRSAGGGGTASDRHVAFAADLQGWRAGGGSYGVCEGRAARGQEEEGVPVIDLNAESTRLLRTMTQEQADQFDAVGHPDATGSTLDRTHLNAHGSEVFGRMVADDLARLCPELGPDVKGQGMAAPAAQPQMQH